MKNLLKFYILIFSFCFAFSQEKSFKVTELTLDNGLKVMLTENSESSDVFGVVAVRAGGKNDPADATGIANYQKENLRDLSRHCHDIMDSKINQLNDQVKKESE